MDRLHFLRAQAWFEEEDPHAAASAPDGPAHLRTQENAFASFEVFEGLASFFLVHDHQHDGVGRSGGSDGLSHGDRSGECVPAAPPVGDVIAFRASLLASNVETRVRIALRPCCSNAAAAGHAAAAEDIVGTKRPRTDSLAPSASSSSSNGVGASELLMRFESGGRSLQGRVLHTHVRSMTENVSDPAPIDEHDALPPFVALRLGPTLELRISPLPELSRASGGEQLRRLVGRMLSSLPRRPAPLALSAPPADAAPAAAGAAAAPAAAVAAAAVASSSDDGWSGAPALCDRIASWHGFLRSARELADELEGRVPSPSLAPQPDGMSMRTTGQKGDTRVNELLAALPRHLVQAMPTSRASSIAEQDDADAAARGAEAVYVELATKLLQVAPCATPVRNGGGPLGADCSAGRSQENEAVALVASAREAMKRAYSTKLSAVLLSGRME